MFDVPGVFVGHDVGFAVLEDGEEEGGDVGFAVGVSLVMWRGWVGGREGRREGEGIGSTKKGKMSWDRDGDGDKGDEIHMAEEGRKK